MRIPIDGRFHQLFAYGGSLDYIRRTAATHHINGVNVAKIIHYAITGKLKPTVFSQLIFCHTTQRATLLRFRLTNALL